ncbi:MAG: TolC family protein, partial [Chryseobacterium sp.]|nr:TolC family protein [Chryseobacterium sp.]
MNNTVNKFLTTALIVGTFYSVSAQEKRAISLEEAVKLGIENSKNLKIDQAKIEESTANLLEAKNKQLPELKVSGSYMYLPLEPNVDLKIPGMSGGGPKVSNVLYGSANLSVPIYSGGRIRYGIQSAEYLVEASKLNSENDKNAIAYNISQAYNNLFKASEVVKLLKENLGSSQKRDQSFIKLENNGVIAKNDRLKAQLQTSNIELQLMEAENNFSIANINMDLMLGLPETTMIETDPNYITALADPDSKTITYYMEQATSNRRDLQAFDYQKKAAALGTKAAKAEHWPSIALTGGYIAADVPNILTVTNAANIGIGVQYNVDNLWKKNSSLLKAQSKERQIELGQELLYDQIKLEVNRDFQNSQFAQKRIGVYEKAAAQANENYRVVNNKYNNGLATITELLDADTAQISANVNVINAKADAML